MPLRQTLLNFQKSLPKQLMALTRSPSKADGRATPPPTSSEDSSDMEDTIVVTPPKPLLPLPTPSESDISILGNDGLNVKEVRKGRAKRVNKPAANYRNKVALTETTEEEDTTDRHVSGQTLVNSNNLSQSSLTQSGVAALNLPWSVTELVPTGSEEDPLKDAETTIEVKEASESPAVDAEEEKAAEKERAEKAAAKRARIEENRRRREEARIAAEEKATRRSARASMLTKASDVVSDFASTILGKRKSGDDGAGPDAKRQRQSTTQPASTSLSSTKKGLRASKDKKWLHSGLYAGQMRSLDGRHPESKNKTQSTENPALGQKENVVMPLPMFAGDRLLKQGRDFKLPFDIFSPLEKGQPKPDEWKKANKNKFVGDAAEEWRIHKFKDHSACMCRPETGCDDDCMNRIMYYECDSHNCNLTGEQCGNRAFEQLKKRTKTGTKYNIGVEVIKTLDRGYGVRSNRTFEPNQIIVEYSGEIINQEEVERRMHSEYKNNECYYLMLFDQNMIIDATTKGSIARFVNHSCNPNCRMEKWTVGDQPRMALFAGERGIMTGEELTYDYNFDPYSLKNAQECRCGEEGCRGILGPRPKEDLKKKDSFFKGVKRKAAEMLGDSKEMAKKRKLQEEEAAAEKRKKASMKGWAYTSEPIKETVEQKFHTMMDTARRAVRDEVRSTSSIQKTSGLAKDPSKFKKAMKEAKEGTRGMKAKAVGISKKTHTTAKARIGKSRVVSTTSAREALIAKDQDSERDETEVKVRRRSSTTATLKSRVGSMKGNAVRTVKGQRSGPKRTLRMINDEGEVDQE